MMNSTHTSEPPPNFLTSTPAFSKKHLVRRFKFQKFSENQENGSLENVPNPVVLLNTLLRSKFLCFWIRIMHDIKSYSIIFINIVTFNARLDKTGSNVVSIVLDSSHDKT